MERGSVSDTQSRYGDKTLSKDFEECSKVLPVSKIRQAAPQVCAVAVKNILLVTYGCTLGFATILIPELRKPDPDVIVSREEVTWIGSLNLILVPVGCLLSGPLSHYLGRRKTMMLANLPFIVAWLVYYYATSSKMLFGALIMTGLTGGLLEAPVLTYVAEITQPHLRGMLSATSTMSVTLGTFIQMLAGSLTTWRNVALINVAFPLLCLVGLYLVPESPHWLIGKKRYDEAVKSLSWLRGWVETNQVRVEFETIRHAIENPVKRTRYDKDEYNDNEIRNENGNGNGNENEKDEKETKENVWRLYFDRRFYLPLLLVAGSFFIGSFGGMQSLQTYSVTIFESLHAPISEYTATVFLGLAQFIGTVCCAILVHFTGKRKLSFVSVTATGLCFFATSIYGLLAGRRLIDAQLYTWLPTTLLISSAFFSHLGIRLLPWILVGEVFPARVRAEGSGLASSFSYLCNFFVNKVFLYMVDGITLPGTFLFYSIVGFVGVILLYFYLPETEGRTLREIEDHYAGVQRLKQRPTSERISIKEKWAASNPSTITDDLESKL